MKESIKIRNFLVVKKADVEIKRINLIIGPQANGKSLIAKLVYFFQSISTEFIDGIKSNKSKRELDKKILKEFELRFPKYSWEGTSFTLDYSNNGIDVSILGVKGARGKTILSILYSECLSKLFNSKKKVYQKKLIEYREQEKASSRHMNVERRVLMEYVIEPMKSQDASSFFSDSAFIPASRSFFANLQKNIFTFLASNLEIDPFLKEFGSLYQNSKHWYKEDFLLNRNKELLESLYRTVETIVNGEYEYFDEQDWILSKGKKVNLANASSGQQEALPMLLVLCFWPILRGSENPGMLYIEEPEAHLFPTSQGHIVSILSEIYSNLGTSFFITTHSPYILSALNNFILAYDSIAEGKITKEEFVTINGSGSPIKFEDVSAYTIIKGQTESISDEDYRMVGGDMLDGISEHFESVMNKLLVCGDGE